MYLHLVFITVAYVSRPVRQFQAFSKENREEVCTGFETNGRLLPGWPQTSLLATKGLLPQRQSRTQTFHGLAVRRQIRLVDQLADNPRLRGLQLGLIILLYEDGILPTISIYVICRFHISCFSLLAKVGSIFSKTSASRFPNVVTYLSQLIPSKKAISFLSANISIYITGENALNRGMKVLIFQRI